MNKIFLIYSIYTPSSIISMKLDFYLIYNDEIIIIINKVWQVESYSMIIGHGFWENENSFIEIRSCKFVNQVVVYIEQLSLNLKR